MRYTYKALQSNKIISKKIEANSVEEVVSFLRNKGCFPISVKSAEQNQMTFLSGAGVGAYC